MWGSGLSSWSSEPGTRVQILARAYHLDFEAEFEPSSMTLGYLAAVLFPTSLARDRAGLFPICSPGAWSSSSPRKQRARRLVRVTDGRPWVEQVTASLLYPTEGPRDLFSGGRPKEGIEGLPPDTSVRCSHKGPFDVALDDNLTPILRVEDPNP